MRLYFAYLAEDAQFDPAAHARDDERCVFVSISQSEGEFSGAEVEIQARPESYLALGRKVAISVEHDGAVHPLIVGVVTASPVALSGEYVTLEVVGRQPGWQAAQEALVESAAVAPYFDPLFVPADQRREPGEVLSGRGATIAWDRVSGEPRLSDVIDGPRTLELTRIDRNSVDSEVEEPPATAVEVAVTAGWSQDASVFSTVAWAYEPQKLRVVADEALKQAWPTEGEEIGGGWLVDSATIQLREPTYKDLGEIPAEYDSAIYSGDVPFFRAQKAEVVLRNARAQAREETLTVRVDGDIQPLTESGVERKSFELRNVIGEADNLDPWQPTASYAPGDVVFYAGDLYEATAQHTGGNYFDAANWRRLDDVQGRLETTFFGTDRGASAVAHAIERAKARLRYAARAVRIEFQTPLEDVLELQIDDRVSMSDPRLGAVAGKVVEYDFRLDAEGSRYATIRIACPVGRGGTDAPAQPDLTQLDPPVLGPAEYPATGSVTPLAAAQIEQLRQAPDAYNVSVRVQIDAPPVPTATSLAYAETLNAGTLSIEQGVTL